MSAFSLMRFNQLISRLNRKPNEGIQFINRPVGVNSNVIFGKTLPTDEACLAFISAPACIRG